MKKIILLIGILLTINSCSEKSENELTPLEQLPKATQTGENTFGCLINGEAFVVSNTSQQVAIYQQGKLQFGGGGISIILENPIEINTNYDFINIVRAKYYVDVNPQLGCHYEFEDTYEGNVTFSKIDRTNYIISGTFEFSTNKDGCEDIKITNGRFDLKYIP
jgi:hypothetical protein